MRARRLSAKLAFVLLMSATSVRGGEAKLVSVERIWDEGGHSAFTDLIRFDDRWFCTFREADGHVRGDGVIRVITSTDGKTWRSAALVAEKGIDLRDPKISITPDGRLMIVAGGSDYGSDYANGARIRGRQPRVLFSKDGTEWTAPRRVLHEGEWLWRVTWHGGFGYGVAYRTAPREGRPADDWRLTLYRTRDGLDYEPVTDLEVDGRPGESTLRVLNGRNETMVAIVRREEGSKKAWIGKASPPYEEWSWREAEHRLGGPNFVQLARGELWAGGRHYPGGARTVLFRARLDPARGPLLEPAVVLPSKGDTSYPGFVWHDDQLWMSYYSSHEGKTSIYLARFEIE